MKYVTAVLDALPLHEVLALPLKEAVHSALPQPGFTLRRYSQNALYSKYNAALS